MTALLGRLGDRVKALHVKDGVVGVNPFLPTRRRSTRPSWISARPARASCRCWTTWLPPRGCEFAVIEFDHFAGDMFDGVQGSVDFFHANGIK